MDLSQTIVQLNKYPTDRYNVLVPVTTMQVASNLQRITVSEVQLDTRQDSSNHGPSKDIYFERSSGAFAITKVAGMKLAAAANISIVDTQPGRTDGCQRCIEMARATGKPRVCGNCEHVHDVAVTVTIRVPEPSGGFRMMKATKEIDCTLEASGMKDGINGQQYRRFLPHRTAMAESKAFMRAIRAALGLAGTYSLEDLKKPFVVARVVPNLDAPEIKQAVASSYLQSMGMLFEMPGHAAPAALPTAQEAEVIPPYDVRHRGKCRGRRPRKSRKIAGAVSLSTTDRRPGRNPRRPRSLPRVSIAPTATGRSPAGRPGAAGSGRRRTLPDTASGPMAASSALSARSGRKGVRVDEGREVVLVCIRGWIPRLRARI